MLLWIFYEDLIRFHAVRLATYEAESRSKMQNAFLAPNLIIQASTELQFHTLCDLDDAKSLLLFLRNSWAPLTYHLCTRLIQ